MLNDQEEFSKARTLIEKHHYGRRMEELEDAEAALAQRSGRIMGAE